LAGVGTYFLTNDNSGVRRVRCIRIPGTTRLKHVRLGDFIVTAVNKGQYKKKFSFKKICYGLVLTRKFVTRRFAGYYIKFTYNRLLLFANKEKAIGNRLYGFITLECKYFKFNKIVVLAKITL